MRGWSAAAICAAIAMVAWLGWHAFDSVRTLEQLRAAHLDAALRHDAILRLEADIQRTAQLAIATGQAEWVALHAQTERQLRNLVAELERGAPIDAVHLRTAVAALDRMSEIEQIALGLQAEGHDQEAFAMVTGPAYTTALESLSSALREFDAVYHDWLLDQSLGLTRSEITSLLGALALFLAAIAAWLILVGRLQREKSLLIAEMEARGRAEAELLRAQKFEVLGELSGTIAHDVDNTLSAVDGYAALAERAVDRDAGASALAGIKRAVQQGRALTRNLLSLVRHEGTVHQPIELGALTGRARDWLAPLLPDDITLVLHNEADGPLWIEADPIQLQQALMNLVLNARDAMPQGGTLSLALARQPGPGPGQESEQPLACISISDNGHGMDEETLRRAFEPFFSTKPQGRGTGLGLPSVEHFTKSSGGSLEIESALGAGTQVRLLIPEYRGPNPPAGRPAAQPRATLVSADDQWRERFARALEDAGLGVSQAEVNGLDALGAAAAGESSLLVLDWRGQPAEAVARLRALRTAGVDKAVLVLMEESMLPGDDALESELADLAMVVSRQAEDNELAQLCRRLASRRARGNA